MIWKDFTLPADTARRREAQAHKASSRQMEAMRPYSSVQVAAAAGTGKTHVLTRRFLRLLLEDSTLRPSEILAVTYTKAGATEMRNRLTEMLAEWAVMPDEKLQEALTRILEKTPAPQTMRHARSLFTFVLDDPVGIRVMTVHSFCQSLLAQFPLEAGVSAGFRILEGRDADALLQEKVAETYTAMADWGPDDSSYWWAFSYMVTHLADASLQSEFKDFIGNRRRYERLFENNGSLDGVLATLADALEIEVPAAPPFRALARIAEKQLEALEAQRPFLKELMAALAEDGGKKATQFSNELDFYLAAASRAEQKERFPALWNVFVKNDGDYRKQLNFRSLQDNYPALLEQAYGFYETLKAQQEHKARYQTYYKTASYLAMAYEIGRQYSRAKESQGYLDFEDLIRHSKKLLTGEAGKAGWVKFKMDGRISHIMLDEAQDTDSDQWDIVRALIDDFYTGAGQHEDEKLTRTFFAVGDGKQAIYRFRGAERHVFEGMHHEVKSAAAPAGHEVKFVDLNTSFRSSDVVLGFVDRVFSTERNRHAIDGLTEPLRHEAFHVGAGGRVEVLPPEPKLPRQRTAEHGWLLPLPERRVDNTRTPRASLFERLAGRVRAMIDTPPFLATEGRFLVPSDIMVLCRTSGHMELFLSALAAAGVTASKTGDLELADAPAVRDMLAMLRFLANPTDDLSLLHALRSPLFALDEAALETLRLAHQRGRAGTYFKTLCRLKEGAFTEKAEVLKTLLNQVDLATPHQLLRTVLSQTQGRGRLLWRYTGTTRSAAAETINQALDSFLDAALDYSAREGTSLIGFLHWFDQGGLRIKIEAGVNRDAVQVMTAHASKGLQAPVVILPEASADFYGQHKKEYKLWRVNPETHQDDLFLFGASGVGRTSLQKNLADAEERRVFEDEMRLLYVALTRAQEQLIVAGTEPPSKGESWYGVIQAQLAGDPPGWQKLPDGTLLREEKHMFTDSPDKPEARPDSQSPPPAPPRWAMTTPKKEQRATDVLATGSGDDESRAAILTQGETRQKFRRGLLLHRLLEVLPGLPDEATRRSKGLRFLAYSGSDLPESKRAAILEDAMGVLESHPDLFAGGYRPEATLAMRGEAGQRLKGRVDYLRVTADTVYIIDYKTDITPPDTVPKAYARQLEAYATMAGSIWPGREVKCGILWTTPTPPRLDWLVE